MDSLQRVFAATEAACSATSPEEVDLASLQEQSIDATMIQAMLGQRGIDAEIRCLNGCDRVIFTYRDTTFAIDYHKNYNVRNYVEIAAAWSADKVWSDLEMILRANRVNLHEPLVNASYAPKEGIFTIKIPVALDRLSELDNRLDTYLNAIIAAADRKFS